jgi:hypothetical protein
LAAFVRRHATGGSFYVKKTLITRFSTKIEENKAFLKKLNRTLFSDGNTSTFEKYQQKFEKYEVCILFDQFLLNLIENSKECKHYLLYFSESKAKLKRMQLEILHILALLRKLTCKTCLSTSGCLLFKAKRLYKAMLIEVNVFLLDKAVANEEHEKLTTNEE